MNLVLAAHKVPHKVAPVHPTQLIIKEISQVSSHRGLAMSRSGDFFALALHIGLVHFLIASVRAARPHPGEEHLALGQVFGIDRGLGFDVLSVHRSPVGVALELVRGIEILPVNQRGLPVLLAGEVSYKRKCIIGLIFVGGGLCAGTDDVHAENRESYQNGGHAKQGGVPEELLALQGMEKPPEAQRKQDDEEEHCAAVVRKPQHIDKEQVHISRKLGKEGYEYEIDKSQDKHSDQKDFAILPEAVRPVFPLAVVIHEHQGGNHQQVQQVYSYAQAHQKGYEDYPFVGVGSVGSVVPHGHGPENHRSEERGHRIDLTLDGREPESVGEAVAKGADKSGA